MQVDGEGSGDLLVPRVEAEAAAAAQIGVGRARGAARPARLQRPFQAPPDLPEAVEPAPDRPLEGGDLDVSPRAEPILAPEEPDPPHREPAVEARLPAVDERRPVLAPPRRSANAEAALDGDAGGGHRQAPVGAADPAVREVVEREPGEEVEAVGEAPPGLEAEVDVARQPGGRMPLEGKVLERRGVPAARHPHADGREHVDAGDGRQDGGLDEPVHRHRPPPVRRPAPEVGELDARAVGREAVGVVPQRRSVRVPHQLDAVGPEGVARQRVRLADDPGLQVEAQGPVLRCLRPELAPHGAERLRQEPAGVRLGAGLLHLGAGFLGVGAGFPDRCGVPGAVVVRRREPARVRLGGLLDGREFPGAVVVRRLGRRPGGEHRAEQQPEQESAPQDDAACHGEALPPGGPGRAVGGAVGWRRRNPAVAARRAARFGVSPGRNPCGTSARRRETVTHAASPSRRHERPTSEDGHARNQPIPAARAPGVRRRSRTQPAQEFIARRRRLPD